jgi:hypothetical protein
MTPAVFALGLALLLPSAPNLKPAAADEPPVLRGEVADWSAIGNNPKVIGSQKVLRDLAGRWGVENVPDVDFRRYVLVVATTLGPELKLETVVDEKGNLEFAARSLIPPGYRVGALSFGIKPVERRAVKTAFGQSLPTD